jgi:hypothetical protein
MANIMKTNQVIQRGLLACFLALAALPASAALKIVPVFVGGTPPTTNFIGGGNLQENFQVAAETWERVFKRGGGNWTLTIYYGWTNSLPIADASTTENGLFAQERFLAEGGNPVRMTQSLVLFHNSPPFAGTPFQNLFMDPTPRDNLKYLRYTTERQNEFVAPPQLNVGRILSEGPETDNSLDLFELCLHEIGHSLGLDSDYSGFKAQYRYPGIVVTAPRPYAGLLIPIDNGPHIGYNPSLLVQFQTVAGLRRLTSAADALLIAQINSFNNPDLEGLPWETNP